MQCCYLKLIYIVPTIIHNKADSNNKIVQLQVWLFDSQKKREEKLQNPILQYQKQSRGEEIKKGKEHIIYL